LRTVDFHTFLKPFKAVILNIRGTAKYGARRKCREAGTTLIGAKEIQYNMGPKQKAPNLTEAEKTCGATAGNTRRPHDVGWPPPAAAPARVFSMCLHMYYLRLPHAVFSVLAPSCIFARLLYQIT